MVWFLSLTAGFDGILGLSDLIGTFAGGGFGFSDLDAVVWIGRDAGFFGIFDVAVRFGFGAAADTLVFEL